MSEIDPEGKWKMGYQCTYCGTLYNTKEEARKCWESHMEMIAEYVWGGIGTGEFPIEVLVKKNERGVITQIATYKRVSIDNVNIRVKEHDRKEK